MTLDSYELAAADMQRLWRERNTKKQELYNEASFVLSVVKECASGVMPEKDSHKWIAVRPETAIAYAESLMKLGQYWDGTRLYEATDIVADNIR